MFNIDVSFSGHELPTPSFDVDDLPPPPPEMSLPPTLPNYLPVGNNHHKSSKQNKPIKRISFDDDVQVIGISEPEIDMENERRILTYLKQPYQANPKKLYSADSKCQAAPPREFLHDLQKVMTKKWQVAEKCKSDQNVSPHTVLGFRDNDLHQLIGHGHDYSRDESVGAWVLHSQQYAATKQKLHKEPIYAVCAKNTNGGYAVGNGTGVHPSPKKIPMPVAPPVVLREPVPQEQKIYVQLPLQHQPHPHTNYGQAQPPQHCHQYPPHHMANLAKKRAPPPPRRSENTHLTTT